MNNCLICICGPRVCSMCHCHRATLFSKWSLRIIDVNLNSDSVQIMSVGWSEATRTRRIKPRAHLNTTTIMWAEVPWMKHRRICTITPMRRLLLLNREDHGCVELAESEKMVVEERKTSGSTTKTNTTWYDGVDIHRRWQRNDAHLIGFRAFGLRACYQSHRVTPCNSCLFNDIDQQMHGSMYVQCCAVSVLQFGN